MSRSTIPLPASTHVRVLARDAGSLQRTLRSVLAGAFLGTVSSATAAAQSNPVPPASGNISTGIIGGTVEDTLATPVAGARVSVVGLGGHGVSENDGTFRLAGIQPGAHVLVVRRIGFRPESVTVAVAAATVSDVRVRLSPNAQWVAPVVIDARSAKYSGAHRGFYERRDRGVGVFFTAEDIEKRDPRLVTDLLRTVPGTRINRGVGQNVVTFRERGCPPLVWIDGTAATLAYLDPDLFDPHSLAGIEVYKGPATVPSILMGNRGEGSCGVIALWTKRVEPTGKVAKKPVSAQDLANLIASLQLYTADQVEVPAQVDGAAPVTPVYPNALLSAGIAGRVVVEFVVDTSGRADMNTFGAVTTTHGLFTDEARRAVAAARFSPALLGGRRVRQLVQLPFAFTVPKP